MILSAHPGLTVLEWMSDGQHMSVKSGQLVNPYGITEKHTHMTVSYESSRNGSIDSDGILTCCSQPSYLNINEFGRWCCAS